MYLLFCGLKQTDLSQLMKHWTDGRNRDICHRMIRTGGICGVWITPEGFRHTVEMVFHSIGLLVRSLSGASWRPRPLPEWRCEQLFPEWSAPASNLKALQAHSQASHGSRTGPHTHVQTHKYKGWLPNTKQKMERKEWKERRERYRNTPVFAGINTVVMAALSTSFKDLRRFLDRRRKKEGNVWKHPAAKIEITICAFGILCHGRPNLDIYFQPTRYLKASEEQTVWWGIPSLYMCAKNVIHVGCSTPKHTPSSKHLITSSILAKGTEKTVSLFLVTDLGC